MTGLSSNVIAGGMPGGDLQSPELKCAVPIAFRWHHGAQREVYVVGSFSNWQTKIRLTREDDGSYGTVVQIVPGIHQYKFIVDGEWRCAQVIAESSLLAEGCVVIVMKKNPSNRCDGFVDNSPGSTKMFGFCWK